MKRIFCIILILLGAPAYADLYKYIDEKGQVVFTDKYVPGAIKIRGSKPSVVPAPKRKEKTPSLNSQAEKPPEIKKAEKYKSIAILQPINDAAIRSNNGDLTISIDVQPALQRSFDHKIKVIFDGKLMSDSWTSASINLKNINRGTHKISVYITDKSNLRLKQSKTIVFHLQRFSRLFR